MDEQTFEMNDRVTMKQQWPGVEWTEERESGYISEVYPEDQGGAVLFVPDNEALAAEGPYLMTHAFFVPEAV